MTLTIDSDKKHWLQSKYQPMWMKMRQQLPEIPVIYILMFLLLLLVSFASSADRHAGATGLVSHHYPSIDTGSTKTFSFKNIQNDSNLIVSQPETKLFRSASYGIKVGSEPRSIAINPTTNIIYIANYLSDTITVLDGNNRDRVIADIKVGKSPAGLALDLTKNIVYVTNQDLNSVSVIDGRTNQVISNFTVGLSPTGIAINPLTGMIYVISSLTDSVSVVEGRTHVMSKMITVGKSPTGIAINALTDMIYVANKDSNSTSVIDGRSSRVVADIPVGHSPYSVAVNPKTNKIFVTNRGFPLDDVITTITDSMSVSVIDGNTNKVIKTLQVGKSPEGIAVDPIRNMVYVANSGSYSVSIVNGSDNHGKVLANVIIASKNFAKTPQVYNLATYLAVNPKTNKVYLTSEDADVVSVLNVNMSAIDDVKSLMNVNKHEILLTGEIETSQIGQPGITLPGIMVGKAPHGIAVNSETNKIYVTNQESNSVSVIDGKTQSVITNDIHVGTFPHVVAINPITNKIYVTNWGTYDTNSSTVSVIDGRSNRMITNIHTGNSPHSVVVNPNTNKAYVTNEDDDTVSVIDGGMYKVLKTIKVGNSPEEGSD